MEFSTYHTWRSRSVRWLVLLAVVGTILVALRQPLSRSSVNGANYNALGMNIASENTDEIKNWHGDCVKRMTSLVDKTDGSVASLQTRFPLTSDARVLYVSADGTSKSAKKDEIKEILSSDGDLRKRMQHLAHYAREQHKTLLMGSESWFIYPDNSVVRADASSCAVKEVMLGDGYDYHPAIQDMVRKQIALRADGKGSKAPKICKKRRRMMEMEQDDADDDGDEGLTHDECINQLRDQVQEEGTKSFSDSVLDIGLSDGSLERQRTASSLLSSDVLMNRVESQLSTENHKHMAWGKKSVVLLEDNTVIVADTATCKLDGIYFSKDREYHPKVQQMMSGKHVMEDSKPKRYYICAPTFGPRCYLYSRNTRKRYRQGQCRYYDARYVDQSRSRPRLATCNGLFRCRKSNRPAYVCQERTSRGYVKCWAYTQLKPRSKHSESCRNYGLGFAGHQSCPRENCCLIRTCPLIRGDRASCKPPNDPESIADTGTIVGNVVTGVQTGLAIAQLILTTSHPLMSAGLGIFSAALGFAGNAAMTGEAALNEAKKYTNKLVGEVYKCMDQRFAVAWEHHIDKASKTLNVIVESGDLLVSSPKANFRRQRLLQVWEPLDLTCVDLSSLYAQYVVNYIPSNAIKSDNAARVAIKGIFFMRTCTGGYTSMMVDQSVLRMTPATTLNRMRAVNYEIHRLIQLSVNNFRPYYSKPDKCGRLSIVNTKYQWMTQNVLKPAAIIAQTSYGGMLDETIVYEYRNRAISARIPTRVVGRNVKDAIHCKQECLALGSGAPYGRGNKCFAVHFKRSTKECIAYLRPISTGSLRTVRCDRVYIVRSRQDAAVPLDRVTRNGCCQSDGMLSKDICLSRCVADRNCIASVFSRNRCGKVLKNSRRLPGSVDYVVFKKAQVIEMVGFSYNGAKGRRMNLNKKQCLTKCAQSPNCVAADFEPGNRCFIVHAGQYGYPNDNKELVYKKNKAFVHWDVFSRLAGKKIHSVRLPSYKKMDTGINAKPLKGPELEEYSNPVVERKPNDWSFSNALKWMKKRQMEAMEESEQYNEVMENDNETDETALVKSDRLICACRSCGRIGNSGPQASPQSQWKLVFDCRQNRFRQVTPMGVLRRQMARNPRIRLRFAIPGQFGNRAFTVTSRLRPRGYPNVLSNFKKFRYLNNNRDGRRHRSWQNFHTDNWEGTPVAVNRLKYWCGNAHLFTVNRGAHYAHTYWACGNHGGIHITGVHQCNWFARRQLRNDPPIGLYYRIL